jgi:hypothetical protein
MASVTAPVIPSRTPALAHPISIIPAAQSNTSSNTRFHLPHHHIVLMTNCAHIPRVPVSRLLLPRFTPSLSRHRLDPLMSALLLICFPALAWAQMQAGSPFAHISAGRATFLTAGASFDRMSALTPLNRTVSTIWHIGCEGSTLTYHW